HAGAQAVKAKRISQCRDFFRNPNTPGMEVSALSRARLRCWEKSRAGRRIATTGSAFLLEEVGFPLNLIKFESSSKNLLEADAHGAGNAVVGHRLHAAVFVQHGEEHAHFGVVALAPVRGDLRAEIDDGARGVRRALALENILALAGAGAL